MCHMSRNKTTCIQSQGSRGGQGRMNGRVSLFSICLGRHWYWGEWGRTYTEREKLAVTDENRDTNTHTLSSRKRGRFPTHILQTEYHTLLLCQQHKNHIIHISFRMQTVQNMEEETCPNGEKVWRFVSECLFGPPASARPKSTQAVGKDIWFVILHRFVLEIKRNDASRVGKKWICVCDCSSIGCYFYTHSLVVIFDHSKRHS